MKNNFETMQGISVLSRQNLVPEHCRNVKSHMRGLRYEVLPWKRQYDILRYKLKAKKYDAYKQNISYSAR
jgi:hypothetical protein